jgi:hypothetical protein
MATAAVSAPGLSHTASGAGEANTTWPSYAVLASAAAIVVGLLWDISWHRTIGRDTFWTPPHVIEQLGAIVAGVSCGWLVLYTTFRGSDALRARSVRFWGFRGPLGAWVTIWGTFVMITSAPFDDWWHNAYGLDVRIVSPPHMMLAMGMISVMLGAMLMLLGGQNRAQQATEVSRVSWAFAASGGVIVLMVATLISEYSSHGNNMHSPLFYQVTAGAFPVFLVAFARSGRLRWPATAVAAIYMAIQLVMLWLLQLFPATPKLAPINTMVTHMVPPEFPLWLVVPALAIDLVLRRNAPRNDWIKSVALGIGFVVLMLTVHWVWGEFLLSSAAQNYVIGGGQWAYPATPGPWQHQFWNVPRDGAGNLFLPALGRGLGIAALIAMVSSRLGLWWGAGMSRVMR